MASERVFYSADGQNTQQWFYLKSEIKFYSVDDQVVAYDPYSKRSMKLILSAEEDRTALKSSPDEEDDVTESNHQSNSVALQKLVVRLALLYSYEAIRQHYASPVKALEPLFKVPNSTIILVLVGYYIFLGIPTFLNLSSVGPAAFILGASALLFLFCAAIVLQAPISEGLNANLVERTCSQIKSDHVLLYGEYTVIAGLSIAALICETGSLFALPSNLFSTLITNVTGITVTNTTTNLFLNSPLNDSNASIVDIVQETIIIDSDMTTIEREESVATPELFVGYISFIGTMAFLFVLCYFLFWRITRYQRISRENNAKEWNLKLLPVEMFFDISDFTLIDYIDKCRMLKDVATKIEESSNNEFVPQDEHDLLAEIEVEFVSSPPQIDSSNYGCLIDLRGHNAIAFERDFLARYIKGANSSVAQQDTEYTHTQRLVDRFLGTIFERETQIDFKALLRNSREGYPSIAKEDLVSIFEELAVKLGKGCCKSCFQSNPKSKLQPRNSVTGERERLVQDSTKV